MFDFSFRVVKFFNQMKKISDRVTITFHRVFSTNPRVAPGRSKLDYMLALCSADAHSSRPTILRTLSLN